MSSNCQLTIYCALHPSSSIAIIHIIVTDVNYFFSEVSNMKEKFFHWVIRFRIPISILSLAASLFCAIASRQVKVNYDMNDYLPAESLSTISLDKMKEEFEGDIPNARVAIKNVSYSEALDYKEKLEEISGISIAIVLLVLILTTTSWLEPFIVLFGIGVAVILNSGTNLIFGEISFVTNAAGSILQLAVSLDYSVFLIHRFQECRTQYDDPKTAMNKALCKSCSSILSSGLTTVIGFLALLFMRFQIGPDLGRALAKGIAISLITVFVFMPGVILLSYRFMDRLSHREFLPSFRRFGKLVSKITLPLACIFCLIMVPAYYFSNQNSYYYGSSHIFSAGTQYGDDTAYIESTFGIKDSYVTSLADMIGPGIPRDMIPDSIKSKLCGTHYNRLVLSVGVDYEGDETFALVKSLRGKAQKYYGDDYYLAGQGVSTYDLMDTITADMGKVNLVAIGAVFVVLLLTMRRLKTPIVLVLAIETAIWINLSLPYLQHKPLFYIAYLIISSVQLGATVDYAILFSDRYHECLKTFTPKESIVEALSQTTASILTSSIVMVTVGFLLGFISTHGLLSQLGYLLGKGTICSLISVLFVLPGLLYATTRKKKKGR